MRFASVPCNPAESKILTDSPRSRRGFKVGVVRGAIIAAICMPLVFTAPQVLDEGDLYDLSITVHIPVFTFIGFGIVWAPLFVFPFHAIQTGDPVNACGDSLNTSVRKLNTLA